MDGIYSLGKTKAESLKKYRANRYPVPGLLSSLVKGESRHKSCVEALERIEVCQSAQDLCYLKAVWSHGCEGGGQAEVWVEHVLAESSYILKRAKMK